MITQNRYDLADDLRYEGLSTDPKPTENVFPNSLFKELDTGNVYYYDANTSAWAKIGGYPISLDGTKENYDKTMKEWFKANGVNAVTAKGLTELVERWYKTIREEWTGGVEFAQPDQSSVSTGTKTRDNSDLSCTPSTASTKNTDDYEGLPLFAITNCNFVYDNEAKRPVITALEGITGNYDNNDPEKLTGVLQMSGFYYQNETPLKYERGVCAYYDSSFDKCMPYPESVEVDGSLREWVLHAKYPNKVVDNKYTSFAGGIPTAWESENKEEDLDVNAGGLCGGTLADLTFLKMMYEIKYASMTADNNLQGCVNYNYQYCVALGEEDVKRVLLTSAQAANIIEGSSLIIGTYDGSSKDRNTATNYNISGNGGCRVLSKETVTVDGTSYVALNLDLAENITTVGDGTEASGNTLVSTWHYAGGYCDSVLGNDGSPINPANGAEPAMLQGIVYSVGGYEVLDDAILSQDAENYYVYVADAISKHSKNSIANYELEGTCPKIAAADAWQYIKKETLSENGFLFPSLVGGSSSTYHRDGFYQNGTNTASGLREYLSFGSLYNGPAGGGLSIVGGSYALSNAFWNIVSRLSCNGNRGEWTA